MISGSELLLTEFYDEIRKPTCRLIALADDRFHDPRIDGLVYAYLPSSTPHPLLERTVDNALDHIHLIHVREQINERLRGVQVYAEYPIDARLRRHRLQRLADSAGIPNRTRNARSRHRGGHRRAYPRRGVVAPLQSRRSQ